MPKKKSTNHYINNVDFFNKLMEWKTQVNEANAIGETPPPITPYIGECFLEIAKNLAKKPNFVNYPFKDDMIGDAVENCLLYCKNFDPTKSENPFSYFTQITYFAFLRRIQKEKKQNYIKFKKLKSMDVKGDLSLYFKQMGFTDEEMEHYESIKSPKEEK
jgi:hypothetical protein